MHDPEEEGRAERPLEAGTITKLAAQQRDPARVSVFLDGAFAFGIHQDLVVEHGLHKGQALGVEAQQRLLDADRARTAMRVALDFLALRARTEQEVRQKLARKGFDEGVCEGVVARLRERGYLDDAAYARSYVQARFRNKGLGPRRLQSELRRRGIGERPAEAALGDLRAEADLLAAAREQAARRWARLPEGDPQKRRKRLADYLLRRGFSYDLVRQVLEEVERAS